MSKYRCYACNGYITNGAITFLPNSKEAYHWIITPVQDKVVALFVRQEFPAGVKERIDISGEDNLIKPQPSVYYDDGGRPEYNPLRRTKYMCGPLTLEE